MRCREVTNAQCRIWLAGPCREMGLARFYSPADFRASLAVDPESLDPAFPRTRRTNPVGMDPSSRSSARGWTPERPGLPVQGCWCHMCDHDHVRCAWNAHSRCPLWPSSIPPRPPRALQPPSPCFPPLLAFVCGSALFSCTLHLLLLSMLLACHG